MMVVWWVEMMETRMADLKDYKKEA